MFDVYDTSGPQVSTCRVSLNTTLGRTRQVVCAVQYGCECQGGAFIVRLAEKHTLAKMRCAGSCTLDTQPPR